MTQLPCDIAAQLGLRWPKMGEMKPDVQPISIRRSNGKVNRLISITAKAIKLAFFTATSLSCRLYPPTISSDFKWIHWIFATNNYSKYNMSWNLERCNRQLKVSPQINHRFTKVLMVLNYTWRPKPWLLSHCWVLTKRYWTIPGESTDLYRQ